MNLKSNYENLTRAKEILTELIDNGVYDPITKAKIDIVVDRIEMTLINIQLEEGE